MTRAHRIWPFCGALVLAVLGCGQSGSTASGALNGTSDIAQVSLTADAGVSSPVELLFVTSTATNDLRVLVLSPDPGKLRDYVRAPNPLESLSIPTVEQPVELARALAWDAPSGQARSGNLLFVRGAGSRDISVVLAAHPSVGNGLRELQRIRQSAGVVTALSARLTGPATAPRVYLYYATWDGQQALLHVRGVDYRADPAAYGTGSLDRGEVIAPLALGGAVTSLLCMPADGAALEPDYAGAMAAVSTRSLLPAPPATGPAFTDTGSAFLFDPGSALTPVRSLTFTASSRPVRKLLTHARVLNPADGSTLLPEGSRIFAVLDESSCLGSAECIGIVAADTAGPNAGQLAFDDSDTGVVNPSDGGVVSTRAAVGQDRRMLPIRFNGLGQQGILEGIGLQAGALLNANDLSSGPSTFPLLGTATVSGRGFTQAQVYFFDGLGLRAINAADVQQDFPITILASAFVTGYGGLDGGPTNIQVGVGKLPAVETFALSFEGVLPNLTNVPLSTSGELAQQTGVWPIPAVLQQAVDFFMDAGVIGVNDLIVPTSGVDAGTECTLAFPVAGFQSPSGVQPGAFVSATDGGVPCASVSGYSVRAGFATPLPWTVTGSISGFHARLAPTAQSPAFVAFDQPQDQYFRPIQLPGQDGGGPGLRFDFPSVDVLYTADAGDNALTRGTGYAFIASSGFAPAGVAIDATSLGYGGLYLPGAVANWNNPADGGQEVFITYPSGNVILNFSPANILPTFPNASGLGIFF